MKAELGMIMLKSALIGSEPGFLTSVVTTVLAYLNWMLVSTWNLLMTALLSKLLSLRDLWGAELIEAPSNKIDNKDILVCPMMVVLLLWSEQRRNFFCRVVCYAWKDQTGLSAESAKQVLWCWLQETRTISARVFWSDDVKPSSLWTVKLVSQVKNHQMTSQTMFMVGRKSWRLI